MCESREEKTVKGLEFIKRHEITFDQSFATIDEAIALILEQREKIRVLGSATKWSSVKDRLPDAKETYLVVRKAPTRAVTLAWYSGENGWLDALDGCFYADGFITHFMPLPELPKEGLPDV